MSMHFEKKLPIPSEIKQRYPLSGKVRAAKEQRDKEIRDIFTGKDDRFILIIGPCSADNEDAVMDYICRLKKVQEQVSDRILIIPRIYTNKPRTHLHEQAAHDREGLQGTAPSAGPDQEARPARRHHRHPRASHALHRGDRLHGSR